MKMMINAYICSATLLEEQLRPQKLGLHAATPYISSQTAVPTAPTALLHTLNMAAAATDRQQWPMAGALCVLVRLNAECCNLKFIPSSAAIQTAIRTCNVSINQICISQNL